ncbi:hypothetical protein [Corynebacterium uterequi]|uniref:DNA binding protein with helix-turn-helix domain n=1 Tax=Corynebacterium uterequi TaxID=1072256 RepID=A0A0G3HGH7_9CORY|nr:hypothetical protein [Corynebacterium uterequi]AKK11048.1 DNA binding protein with helix-turn-helix domain [Corynebacterium uterequi]
MSEMIPPSPEGLLIRSTRENLVPRLSIRAAASVAGISESRWRQIEKGSQRAAGADVPAIASDELLGTMAHVVELTPEDLQAVGRAGAAKYLAQLNAIERDRNRMDVDLSDVPSEALIAELARRLSVQWDGAPGGPPTTPLLKVVSRRAPRQE